MKPKLNPRLIATATFRVAPAPRPAPMRGHSQSPRIRAKLQATLPQIAKAKRHQ